MPVCLHCGEIGPEGALFCGNCGYTLPQPGVAPAPPASPVRPPPASSAPPPGVAAAPPFVPPGLPPSFVPASAYAVPAARAPGSVGAMVPPPSAKYCVRCATLISSAAVYCPVCQQPQV